MKKTYYLVPKISTAQKTNIGQNVEMSWADGMFGVMPVFTNKRKAEKYAGKHKNEIIEFKSLITKVKAI